MKKIFVSSTSENLINVLYALPCLDVVINSEQQVLEVDV